MKESAQEKLSLRKPSHISNYEIKVLSEILVNKVHVNFNFSFFCSNRGEGAFVFIETTKQPSEKVQVSYGQEKAQSEKDSHSKNRGGKKAT